VGELRAAGRWTRLAAELDALDRDLADATAQFRDAERRMAGLLDRRGELRGLLDAYQAKAARLGAVEDLASLHDQARDLLWTAPCDLDVAEQAVQRYQHEVNTRGARR
jgi:chromosome segregation ATPase